MESKNGPKDLESLTDKFCKESKYALIKFANVVNKSNLFCDMEKYELWKHIEMNNKSIDISMKNEEVIDSIQSDAFQNIVDLTNLSLNNVEETEIQSPTDEDVITSLKEHFKSSNHIPPEAIEVILTSPQETIGKIFMNLSGALNSDQILILSKSLENHLENEVIMENFCRCLLMKMTTIFTQDLKVLFLKLCTKLLSKLVPHIANAIENNDSVDVFSLYLIQMDSTLQETLLCEILRTHSNFSGKYILIAKCLLNKDMSYNSFKKLMEVMANNVEQYATDKEYGNLLFKVVTYLGKDSTSLENILRHILNNHKSIWKAKMQKMLPTTESQEF